MFNFNFNIGIETVTIEVKLGNEVISSQRLQGPLLFIYQQYIDLVNQVAQDDRPIKVTAYGEKQLELPSGEFKAFPSRVMFANNVYLNTFDIED